MTTTYLTPLWKAPPSIHAVCTKRYHPQGYSKGVFNNFNLGTHVGDEVESVKKNRTLLTSELALAQPPIWLNQVHGHRCITIDSLQDNRADAIVSREKNRVCAIMTADCLPILLCNNAGNEIAAIHGGWRSLCQGIIPNTLSQMQSSPQELMAWLGPCISQSAFEVGTEVYRQFYRIDPIYKKAFQKRDDKYLASLVEIATIQLRKLHIPRVKSVNQCTYDASNGFFSYRRDGQTGRMASLIWIA